VLADFLQTGLLAYESDSVERVTPSTDSGGSLHPMDLTPLPTGFLMAAIHQDLARYLEGVSLLRLGEDLKPMGAWAWPEEWGEDTLHGRHAGRPETTEQVVVSGGELVAWLDFADPERDGLLRFALPEDGRNE